MTADGTARPLQAGDRVGRYLVEAPIGEGGMGTVYRALDEQLHRRIALKVIRADSLERGAEREARSRLLREARAAAAFNHPNAVTVYEIGDAGDRLFIAMEYVEGSTLRQLLGRGGAPWLGAAHPAPEAPRRVRRRPGVPGAHVPRGTVGAEAAPGCGQRLDRAFHADAGSGSRSSSSGAAGGEAMVIE